jgi:hypothetical protein
MICKYGFSIFGFRSSVCDSQFSIFVSALGLALFDLRFHIHARGVVLFLFEPATVDLRSAACLNSFFAVGEVALLIT